MGSWKYAVRVLSIYYKNIDITDSLNKNVKKSSDLNSSLEFMCRQYRNHLIALNKTCTNLHEFGDKIMFMVLGDYHQIAPEVPLDVELPPVDSYFDLSIEGFFYD